jgi:hypothetical protein
VLPREAPVTTYVRVKDPETKHELDMPEQHPLIAKGLVVPVKSKRYPPSHVERPMKPYMSPASIRARQSATSPEAPQVATEKENLA